jgi:hypothetical protein
MIKTDSKINVAQTRLNMIKQALRDVYAWPGGYPLHFFAHDGGLCHKCVRENFRAVVNDTKMNVGPWNLGVEILWEGEHYCADCGDELETAYGNDNTFEE